MCKPSARLRRLCWGAGGGGQVCHRFSPTARAVGRVGRKSSTSVFPCPNTALAHGLHPRFVVAENWANTRGAGGGEAKAVLERMVRGEAPQIRTPFCAAGVDGALAM